MSASKQVDFVLAPYAAQPNMPKSAVMQDMVVKPPLADRFVIFAAADIPFVHFIVLPGHMTGLEAIIGPALWVSGAVFSTLGMLTGKHR